MNPSAVVRVKICCTASVEEAQLAIAYGASAVGLVSAMPSGPGPITEELIASIARTVAPGVATFLLTSRQDAAGIIAQHRRTQTNTIQIVDEFPIEQYRILRNELPGVKLVQVIHVQNQSSVEDAIGVSGHVDAILLDSGNPGLPTKELGGTGRPHDWSISRTIRERVDVPVYLAGGLNSGNVGEAIGTVKPFAVDVCSGVRTDGKLDERKLSAFFDAVRIAGAPTS
jgi:phosphoribosylanthranilate isomerase